MPSFRECSPCAKGNEARVGPSGPHALFITIFNDFFDGSICPAFVPHARKGKVDS